MISIQNKIDYFYRNQTNLFTFDSHSILHLSCSNIIILNILIIKLTLFLIF